MNATAADIARSIAEGHEGPDTAERAAERFGLPIAWARTHLGRHVCIDGRNYVGACLVLDPSCDALARSIMTRRRS